MMFNKSSSPVPRQLGVASVYKKYHMRLAALPEYTSGQLVLSVSQKSSSQKNNNPLLLLACSFMQVPAY